MKQVLNLAVMLVLSFPALAGAATLTTDPLTKLPIIPTTSGGMIGGNDPMQLPETRMCKSKMQANFYTVNTGKLSATIA